MAKIEFIYFDLGNVLISFDHSRAFQQIAELTGIAPAQVEQVLFGGELQSQYERGEISTREFHRYFCEQAGVKISVDDLCLAASNIFEPIESSLQLLNTLNHTGHRLGLLSNTCDCHWRFLLEDDRFGFLHSGFEQIVLSFVEGWAKPEAGIFGAAANLANCDPETILFIDDLPENVEGARSSGLDAFHYRDHQTLIDALTRRGLLQQTMV